MEEVRFEKSYTIPVYETGADERLNIHSLFNIFQDIASEHAVRLGFGKDDLMRQNRFWVLSRIAADIRSWPGWRETIVVKTWPRGTEKLFALRDFTVTNPDGKHIASASSSWLVVDINSRRVQRPDSVLTMLKSGFPSDNPLGRNAGKIETAEDSVEQSNPFRIKPSDLDMNMHTNNVNYIRWASDTYEPEFRKSFVPETIEANYLAESRWNEEITIHTSRDSKYPLSFKHSILRIVDNTELCRIRIDWKDCRL